METALPTFQSFDPSPDAGAPGPRWEKYVNRLKNLITALDIKNAERQKALLLHYVGEETNNIFDTLTVCEPVHGEIESDCRPTSDQECARGQNLPGHGEPAKQILSAPC